MPRRRTAMLIATLLGAAVLGPACGDDEGDDAPPDPAAQQRSCGQVAFTPQSDHGAFDIVATGTSCATARAVATAAEDQSRSFSAEGFDCTGELDRDAALPSTTWACTSGDARVTFVTS